MMRSLWVAKTGLDAQQTNLDVISNNLANISTTAYKRTRPVFEDLVYQNLRVAGLYEDADTIIPTGLQVGNGSRIAATQRINTAGAMVQSQNPLDMAITGEGFFQVDLGDGTVAYTRAGNFVRGDDGSIQTASGLPVLSVSGSKLMLPSNISSLLVGGDGNVSAYLSGNTATPYQIGQVAVYSFVNPAGLASGGGGLYTQTMSSGDPQGTGEPGQNGVGGIAQYYTEQSNVNVAEELVSLIAAQRAYEITAKSVTASDQMLQKLGQL